MKRFSMVFSIVLHIFAGATIFYFFRPIASWYLNKIPALGIDLYNSVNAVSLHQKHFSFWFNGFKDIWYGGYPFVHDFPQFHYYFMIPFANVFGSVKGAQIYVMVSLFLLLFFSYLLFYRLSKNHGLSLLLSILILLSPNIYGAAVWGGSLPYFATQFFLPLTLLCCVTYFNTSSIRWFWASVLFAGFGFLGHPLPVAAFIFPAVLFLLLLCPQYNKQWNILERIRNVGIFFTGVVFVDFILFFDYFHTLFNGFIRRLQSSAPSVAEGSAQVISTTGNTDIATFYKNQIALLISGTNNIFFLLLAIGVIVYILVFLYALLLKKEKKDFLIVLPFFAIAIYAGGHAVLNLLGHNFLSQGLYRAFWAFPIVLGALVASLWRPLFLLFIGKKFLIKLVYAVFSFAATIIFVVFAYGIFTQQASLVIESIHKLSDTSSAFPEVLSMKIAQKEQNELKKKLLPSFINPKDKNKRLYTSDATVNIWWNSFYDTPLIRGYIDPPIGTDRRSGIFLLDTAIGNDSLVRDFKYSVEMAKNYALFFIDWYSVYFFEGGHLSPASSVPPSSYLLDGDIFDKKEQVTVYGAVHRYETKSGRPEARFDLPQSLIYYKVNDKYTSPVIYGSDAPTLLVFSDDPSFEQIWRALASENINSRFVIPVHGGKYIDSFDKKDLEDFDAIVLHNYSYRDQNKAFGLLTEYVEKGGRIFIDTGGEVKESESDSLPQLLPISTSQRREVKKNWNFEILDQPMTNQIDFSKIGPPVFNKNAWKFSFPKNDSDVRKDSKIVLKNYGKPVVIIRDYGLGKVIWSGLNLPYHFNQYPTIEEGKFFRNIIEELIPLKSNKISRVQAEWERPEKVRVQDVTSRGLLFKEEIYEGWKVKLTSGRKSNLKLYKAGPTYPGFMYVPLRSAKGNPVSLEFTFNGILKDWIVSLISLISVFVILELIIFDGKFIGRRVRRSMLALHYKTKKRVGSWWEKEEEE